jgi:hypothetical protein
MFLGALGLLGVWDTSDQWHLDNGQMTNAKEHFPASTPKKIGNLNS